MQAKIQYKKTEKYDGLKEGEDEQIDKLLKNVEYGFIPLYTFYNIPEDGDCDKAWTYAFAHDIKQIDLPSDRKIPHKTIKKNYDVIIL